MADGAVLTDDELFAAVRRRLEAGRAGEWPIEALRKHALRLKGMMHLHMVVADFRPVSPEARALLPRIDKQLLSICVELAAAALHLASSVEVRR